LGGTTFSNRSQIPHTHPSTDSHQPACRSSRGPRHNGWRVSLRDRL